MLSEEQQTLVRNISILVQLTSHSHSNRIFGCPRRALGDIALVLFGQACILFGREQKEGVYETKMAAAEQQLQHNLFLFQNIGTHQQSHRFQIFESVGVRYCDLFQLSDCRETLAILL